MNPCLDELKRQTIRFQNMLDRHIESENWGCPFRFYRKMVLWSALLHSVLPHFVALCSAQQYLHETSEVINCLSISKYKQSFLSSFIIASLKDKKNHDSEKVIFRFGKKTDRPKRICIRSH